MTTKKNVKSGVAKIIDEQKTKTTEKQETSGETEHPPTFAEMIKSLPEDATVSEIMEEKQCNRNTAFKLMKDREETAKIKTGWKESEKPDDFEKKPITIPKQLQPFKFCFVEGKHPQGKGWQKEENTYSATNPKLTARLKRGDSYGLMGGFKELMIVDADNDNVFNAFYQHHDSLTGETGNGKHLFFVVPGLQKSIALQEIDEENSTPGEIVLKNVGHITSKGRMVVGPNCLHYNQVGPQKYEPSGKRYKIVKDVEIKTITEKQLMVIIDPFLAETIRAKQESKKRTDDTKKEYKNIKIDISLIADKMSDLKKQSPGYRGHNPSHPRSKSRMDLTINTETNTWLCSACCNSGYGFGNSLYLIALNEGILQCHECKKGSLRGDKFLQVKKLAIEKYSIPESTFAKKFEKDVKDEKNVNKIIAEARKKHEKAHKPIAVTPGAIDASMEGCNIIVKGRVVAEKRQKALPHKIKWECSRCKDKECEFTVDIRDKTQFLHRGKKTFNGVLASLSERMWITFPSVRCEGRDAGDDVDPKWFGTITSYEDYTILWLNDRLEDQRDLKSSEKKLRVALLGVKPTLGMLVEIEGIVDVDPFSSDLTVIGHEIKETGTTADNFVLDEQTKKDFNTYFKDKAIENIIQIAPDMIGYQIVKLSRLLVLHSLLWIKDLNGKKIRGVLRELLFGDTKTNKSKSIKDNIEKYHLGEWYSAETGSRAGLLYYADTEKRAISWGILPQNDRGYVGIDALNSLKKEEWSKFKEALEDLKVKVAMAVQGSANIRTRMSLTMNPPKTMSDFLCRCEAIKDTYIFKDKSNITRIDIFLPFSQGDVKDEDVIDRKNQECPIPKDIFAKHIYWAWGLTEENIKINDDAIEKIKEETKHIMKEYQTDVIPIVHLATRDVITRLSVAMAILNHSTEDCVIVNVRSKDVEMASTFYINMLEKLDLRLYKNLIKSETSVNEEETSSIFSEFEAEHYRILNLIMTGPKGSKELGKLIGVSEKTIKRKYDNLQKYDLIKATTGKGVTLTRRGIFFVKKCLKLENEEKTENMSIRRIRDTNVPLSLMKQRSLLSNTLNIDNNNDDKNLYDLFQQNYVFSEQLVKDSKKNTIDMYIEEIKNAFNKINKKYIDLGSIDLNSIRDTGTNVSPSTVVDEKITFFKNNGYSKKIEEIMQTKSRHEWAINDLSFALGFADVQSRKALHLYLDEITADPKNPTRIRRADKDGLFWRLVL